MDKTEREMIERIAQDIKKQVEREGLELKGYFVNKIPNKLVFNAEVTDPKSGNTFFYPIELYKRKTGITKHRKNY